MIEQCLLDRGNGDQVPWLYLAFHLSISSLIIDVQATLASIKEVNVKYALKRIG